MEEREPREERKGERKEAEEDVRAPARREAEDGPDVSALTRQLERLNFVLERMGVGFFLDLHRRPWKLFWVNVLAGMGRGLGFVLGATVLVALILWFLRPFFSIPVLGKWIAKIADVVRENMLRGAPPQ